MGGQALHGRRVNRIEIETLVEEILEPIKQMLEKWLICGSYRRKKPDSGDIDLVYAVKPEFNGCVDIELEYLYGCKSTLIKKSFLYKGVQVEMLESTPVAWGAMILYATGPGTLNVDMRRKAKELGYKLNQYGLWQFDIKLNQDICVASLDEKDIFAKLGMPWLEPEDRT